MAEEKTIKYYDDIKNPFKSEGFFIVEVRETKTHHIFVLSNGICKVGIKIYNKCKSNFICDIFKLNKEKYLER
jgi:hypothetical protein